MACLLSRTASALGSVPNRTTREQNETQAVAFWNSLGARAQSEGGLARFVIMPPPRGGWGHCKRERGRLRLSPARARAHAPARDRAGALEDLPRRDGGARRGRPAPVRGGRVQALPYVRHPRQWLRARALRSLRRRAAGGLQLQRPRLLPLLHQPPHARHRRPPRRARDPAGAGAPAGPILAALGALPAR